MKTLFGTGYRVFAPGWLLFHLTLLPALVVLIVELTVGWRYGRVAFCGMGFGLLVNGFQRQSGTRWWLPVAIALLVLAVLDSGEGLPLPVRRAVLFAAAAVIGTGYVLHRLFRAGRSPIFDAGAKGLRIRGGRWHPWETIDTVEADPDEVRIRFVDGSETRVSAAELPPDSPPRLTASRIRQVRGR